MSIKTPYDFNQAICPVIISAGAILSSKNPFRLPENSYELDRFRFLAITPFVLFASSTLRILDFPETWRNESISRCLAIAGDFAEEFRDTICLYDLCPAAGEREEMTNWVKASRNEALPPDKELKITTMVCDLMAIRFPRFLYDYTQGMRLAKNHGSDHWSALAFTGISKNFLIQTSVNPEHHTTDAVANFSTIMEKIAPEVLDVIIQEAPNEIL